MQFQLKLLVISWKVMRQLLILLTKIENYWLEDKVLFKKNISQSLLSKNNTSSGPHRRSRMIINKYWYSNIIDALLIPEINNYYQNNIFQIIQMFHMAAPTLSMAWDKVRKICTNQLIMVELTPNHRVSRVTEERILTIETLQLAPELMVQMIWN